MWYSRLLTRYVSLSPRARKALVWAIGIAGVELLADFTFSKLSEQSLHNNIVEKFRTGTTEIEIPPIPYYCYRKEVEQLHEVFHNREREGTFTVVAGPVGCGKTFIVWKAIVKNPQGIVYYEVSADDLAMGLGKAAGMKFKTDVSFLEVLRSRFSAVNRVTYHFSLPDDDIKALGYVVKEINMQANRYYKKYNERPTMVIDAVDWLSKTNYELFKALILLMKQAVNNSSLNVVLVSSEGHVLPMLDKQSEASRSKVFYVGDVDLIEAEALLTRCGIPNDLSSKVASFTGGRLILLYRARGAYKSICYEIDQLEELDEKKKEEMKWNKIKKYLWNLVGKDVTNAGLRPGYYGFEHKKFVVELLMKSGDLPFHKLVEELRGKFNLSGDTASNVVDHLIRRNVLSTVNELVTFQSTLHKQYLEELFL